METTGDLVAATVAELAAGVKHRQHDLGGRATLLLHRVDGDTAAVVGDRDAVVGVDDDLDVVGLARQRLVDGVVDHLVDQVMEPAGAGGADVHTRALADGLEALQDGDVLCVVAGIAGPTVASALACISASTRRATGLLSGRLVLPRDPVRLALLLAVIGLPRQTFPSLGRPLSAAARTMRNPDAAPPEARAGAVLETAVNGSRLPPRSDVVECYKIPANPAKTVPCGAAETGTVRNGSALNRSRTAAWSPEPRDRHPRER